MSAREGRHDSGKTSTTGQSGDGGRHTRREDRPDGYAVGTRQADPRMHPDGWDSRR